MNLLLTGGAGYIGSHVALALLDQGHKVTIIDNLINGSKRLIPKKAIFLKCDIADNKKISNLLKNNQFDAVIHFAGFTRVSESIKYPEKYFKNNFEKPKIFFKTCIKFGLVKIIFSSTGSVYGNVKHNNKIIETEKTKPINPYSKSKLKLEKHLLYLAKKKKINAIILRYFNVAGADSLGRSGLITNPDNLIKAICEVATGKKNKLIVNGNSYKTKDGTAIRDFIHVSDLAEMHVLTAKNFNKDNICEIYNCGYGRGYSIKDVIKAMNIILNKKIKVEYGENRKGDSIYSVACNKKFVNKFYWKPRFNNLNIILKTALKWEKKINDRSY
jgi:UDP-glucose 4-epimerase